MSPGVWVLTVIVVLWNLAALAKWIRDSFFSPSDKGDEKVRAKERGHMQTLEQEVVRLRGLLQEREQPSVGVDTPADPSPSGVSLSFEERLKRVGYSFEENEDEWSFTALPESIRYGFMARSEPTDEEPERRVAVCASCIDRGLAVVSTDKPVLHPGKSLGIFCTDCGRGRLFIEVNRLRRMLGLAELPDDQLMKVIIALEAEAKRLGLFPAPPEDATAPAEAPAPPPA